MSGLLNKLYKILEEKEERMVEIRRYLHQNPRVIFFYENGNSKIY